MNDQLYFRNVPAHSFPFIQLPQAQLELLLSNTRFILERLERAKKGVFVLDHFRSRLYDKQVVRCTPQSVKVTAAARYAPSPEDLNLSSISTRLFVDLVTYLPLPEIRILARNHDALLEASKISMEGEVDGRWGTYYTCLGAVNKEWAQLFFNEIQKELAGSDRGTAHQIGAGTDGNIENNRMSDGPAVRMISHIATNITTERSNDTTHQQHQGPSNHEFTTSTTHTENNTPTTSTPWNQNIDPTDTNTDPFALHQAETTYLKVLLAKGKAWGPTHETTLETMRKLGQFYAQHGKLREAEEIYLRVLEGSEGQMESDAVEA